MTNSPFDHQSIDPTPDNTVRIERLIGILPQVTTAPTWTPKKFVDQFAVDGTNKFLYVYDVTNNAWLKATLT